MSAPTLFLAPRLGGIVYVDPAQHLEVSAACRSLSDATVLPVAAVLLHKERFTECFAPVEIPANEGIAADAENHFEAYARLLMDNDQFPMMRAIFD